MHMFYQKQSPSTVKKVLFLFLIVTLGTGATGLLPESNASLSSSIVQPTLVASEWGNTTALQDTYAKQVQKIRNNTRDLEEELWKLFQEKESLQSTLHLKQQLLIATQSHQEGNIDAESEKATQGMIKNLEEELWKINKDLQQHDTKIADIYTKISAYGKEIDSLSELTK
jgi:hypothetical protein